MSEEIKNEFLTPEQYWNKFYDYAYNSSETLASCDLWEVMKAYSNYISEPLNIVIQGHKDYELILEGKFESLQSENKRLREEVNEHEKFRDKASEMVNELSKDHNSRVSYLQNEILLLWGELDRIGKIMQEHAAKKIDHSTDFNRGLSTGRAEAYSHAWTELVYAVSKHKEQ